jgi:hypothetical protein
MTTPQQQLAAVVQLAELLHAGEITPDEYDAVAAELAGAPPDEGEEEDDEEDDPTAPPAVPRAQLSLDADGARVADEAVKLGTGPGLLVAEEIRQRIRRAAKNAYPPGDSSE